MSNQKGKMGTHEGRTDAAEDDGGRVDDAMGVAAVDTGAETGVDVGMRVGRARHDFERADHVVGRQRRKLDAGHDPTVHVRPQELFQVDAQLRPLAVDDVQSRPHRGQNDESVGWEFAMGVLQH